jgi:hypothetical protein
MPKSEYGVEVNAKVRKSLPLFELIKIEVKVIIQIYVKVPVQVLSRNKMLIEVRKVEVKYVVHAQVNVEV